MPEAPQPDPTTSEAEPSLLAGPRRTGEVHTPDGGKVVAAISGDGMRYTRQYSGRETVAEFHARVGVATPGELADVAAAESKAAISEKQSRTARAITKLLGRLK